PDRPLRWLLVGGEALAASVARELEGRGHKVSVVPACPSELPDVDRIVHLAGTSGGDGALRGLMDLARTLVEKPRPVVLALVTDGVLAVAGDEALSPERALLLGPLLALPWEASHVRCRHVDLDSRSAIAATPRLVAELLEEPDGRSVALRGALRWALGY